MKKGLVTLVFSLLLSAGFSTGAFAQKGLPRFNRKALMDSMTPEEKKAMRQQLKARYDSLPAEQKEMIKEKIKERFDSLPPQQKRKLLKQLKNNKSAANGR